jgi:D-arabinose 1-dehydrogenase-like Zn-dependent alcohol dehydrogenase
MKCNIDILSRVRHLGPASGKTTGTTRFYPCVPGHEVIGRVNVRWWQRRHQVRVGDVVGVAWLY